MVFATFPIDPGNDVGASKRHLHDTERRLAGVARIKNRAD